MRLILLRTILGAAVLAVPIAASAGISLSPIMQAWNHDRRSIQAMLSGRIPYDETQIRQELENYITNSSAAARNAHGGSAEARDFAARFDAFANDSRLALGAASQPSALRQNFDRMLSDCRSCHAIYNN
jgi:cytochrome c556